MSTIRFVVVFFLLISTQFVAAEPLKPTKTLSIPMRDGVELTTDIYLPDPEAKNLPCILLRSPAGRHAATAQMYTPLIKQGYMVVVQDTRSAMDSEGKTFPYLADGWGKLQDGFDTIEWIAKSPYSNGKIGTAGWSAMGITQLLLAPTAPDGLKCQFIGVAAPNIYHYAAFPGGTLLKNQVEGWLGMCAKDPSVLHEIINQPVYNDFWHLFNSLPHASKVNVPAIHYGGWFDIFSQGTIDAFLARQENGGEGAKGSQKLLMGPWTHLYPQQPKIGDFDVPKGGEKPTYDLSPERLFARYLKDENNEFENLPAVTYYVMGPFDGSPSSGNVWKSAQKWPVDATFTPFYLTQNLELVEAFKPADSGKRSYLHQNENPVPTIGGNNLFLESGPKDQRSIEQRPDVLVFSTAPLTEDIEVTGRVLAKLFVSSTEPHGDVAIRLTDVYPDGKSILILDSLTHMGHPHNVSLKPNIPSEVQVDLWSTSIVFAKGHRIRVIVSGSNFPRFHNTFVKTENGKAPFTIHFSEKEPSQIILPIVRRGENN